MYYILSKYWVIHKPVKHLTNSRQIKYATGHNNSYANRERSYFFSSLLGGGAHMEVHAALRPVIGLLYLSRVIVRMGRSWWNEMWLPGKTEVLGEILLQRHFVHHKSHLPDPGANTGCRGGKTATNRLSYGAA
jgi:hypothetical protein